MDNLPFVDYDRPTKPFSGLVLVGEAPGADEVRLGHPFVGRSGQLLDKLLAEAKIDRATCLVANVFRLRPPGNKVDHFFASKRAAKLGGFGINEEFGKFGSNYCRTEFAGELLALRNIIHEYKPRMVMALGRTPLWALTGENGLLSKIGQTLPCRIAPPHSVIPTYHPSFIMRGNWGLQGEWLGHFQRAHLKTSQ